MNFQTFIIVIPIFAFSVLGIAIIIERFMFFSKNHIDFDKYRYSVINDTYNFKSTIINNAKTVFDVFLKELFMLKTVSKQQLNEFIDSRISSIEMDYEKRISYLGIFAKLSTLLGLFGTVIGMIFAFDQIVTKGISNASIVASGIKTAMLTTAIGLAVAIPATFFHDFFKNLIIKEKRKMEIIISEVILQFSKNSKPNTERNNNENN